MKKRIVSCLIICAVLVLSFFYSHIEDNTCVYSEDADISTYISTGTLSGDEELTQAFVAQEESIDGIRLKVDLLGNVENVILHYTLLDESLNELYKGTVPATELENQEFNVLKTSKISNASGKKYVLVLSEENSDLQNGVSFHLTPGRPDGEDLMIKGNSTDAALVVEFICNRFDLETYVVLIGMITFIAVFMKVLYKMFK